MPKAVLGNKKIKNDEGILIKEIFGKDRMSWLPDDKEIFIGKLDYLKNYYEGLKSFGSLLFLQ